MQTADYPWLQTPIFEEKRKVQRLVLSANIKHYNNRIVDFFSPQLHGCACSLQSFFSAQFQNKLESDPFRVHLLPHLFTVRTPLFCFHPVSQTEVSNTLKSVSFKSCELDPIRASLLFNYLPYLLSAITVIGKASLRVVAYSADSI